MNSTCGLTAAGCAGPSRVPRICWPSTAISTASSFVDIRLYLRVLEYGASVGIDTVKVDDRSLRRRRPDAEHLDAPGTHGPKCGVSAERLQGRDLGAAGPADSPGLLQHTRTPVAPGVGPLSDVIVPPGREQARELLGRRVVRPRLGDGQLCLRRQS